MKFLKTCDAVIGIVRVASWTLIAILCLISLVTNGIAVYAALSNPTGTVGVGPIAMLIAISVGTTAITAGIIYLLTELNLIAVRFCRESIAIQNAIRHQVG